MIAFLDQIVTWHEFIDDTETHAILGDATFAIDIGPWKAGQYVKTIQLAAEDNGEGQVFIEEVDDEGKIINRCQVVMVEKALVESYKREILELRDYIKNH